MPTFSRKTVLAGGTAAVLAAGGLGAAAAADPEDPGLSAPDLQRLADAAIDAAGGGRVTATDADDGVHEVEVTLDDGTEVEVTLDHDLTVVATRREAPDPAPPRPIGTPDLAGAADAAVRAAGGGRVTGTDVEDDDESYSGYEIEVTLDDGTEVDVQLDRDLTVTGTWRDLPDTLPGQPIGTPDLTGAAEAAVRAAGGGRVTGSDVEDDATTYEVEVTLDDGTQVDVQLDRDLDVVGTWREGPDDD